MSMTLTAEADLVSAARAETQRIRSEGEKAQQREDELAKRRINALEASTNQTSTDAEIVNAVMDLFYTARQYRRPLVSRWEKSYKMLRGRYWNEAGRANWMPSPQVPEIFPIVRSTVGWMTDRRFKNTVAVAAPPFSAHHSMYNSMAQDLETVLDSTWHVNAEEGEVILMLWDAFTYGTGILKTTWDNSLAGGLGDAKMQRVDQFGFYPDPVARNLDTGNYFVEVKNMSLQELDRRFPGSYEKLASKNLIESFDEVPDQMQVNTGAVPRANPAAIGASTGIYGRPGGPGQLSTQHLHDEGVTVFECWVREHEHFDRTVQDPERGEIKTHGVFDTWRVYVVAGNTLLLNAPAESIWQHGKHPYSRFVPYDLGEFWGMGLVELLTSAQESLNRLLAAALQNIDLTGNPVFKEDARSGTQRTLMQNKPGQRLTVSNSQSTAEWLKPPPLQNNISEFMRYFLSRMEAISGLSAMTQGQAPSGRPAEGVMDAVQEAAFVGVRLALKELEYTLRDAGTKKASLIIENYQIPRIVAITGDSGMRSTLGLRSQHFMLPTSTGKVPMEYTLLVDAGAGSDTSRKVREDKAITLFTLGALDFMSLLEALQWPNREQVYQRVMAQQQSGMFQPAGQRQKARA